MTPRRAKEIIDKWRSLRKSFAVDEKTGQIDLFSLINTQGDSTVPDKVSEVVVSPFPLND